MIEDNVCLKKYISNEELVLKIKLLADKINEDYFKLFDSDTPLYTICLLKGGVMFYTELLKHLKMPVKMNFVTLSSYGEQTYSSGVVNVVEMNLPDLNNKNVLVVDDIIDQGCTLDYFSRYLNSQYDLNYLNFAVLLDKKIERDVLFKDYYKALDIENEFVVGFGMDYKELYRNLDYIAILEQN